MEKDKIETEPKMNQREKVILLLVIFVIRMIRPWKYEHQYEKFWSELKEQLN